MMNASRWLANTNKYFPAPKPNIKSHTHGTPQSKHSLGNTHTATQSKAKRGLVQRNLCCVDLSSVREYARTNDEHTEHNTTSADRSDRKTHIRPTATTSDQWRLHMSLFASARLRVSMVSCKEYEQQKKTTMPGGEERTSVSATALSPPSLYMWGIKSVHVRTRHRTCQLCRRRSPAAQAVPSPLLALLALPLELAARPGKCASLGPQ